MSELSDRADLDPLFGDWHLSELIERSIETLRRHEPPGGYHGRFSGGKDSVVIKQLAKEACVKVRWTYSKTTMDPPELVRFIRGRHSDVGFLSPRHGNFFRYAAEVRGFPTRRARWCCGDYKEAAGVEGDTMLIGIRAEESSRRAGQWREYQEHRATKTTAVLPILHWASDEVWAFIKDRGLPYCSLYDEGFHRLGCVGCPMAPRNMPKEFARWPAFETKWRRVIRRTWERREGTMQRNGREWFGSAMFSSWEELWLWWSSSDQSAMSDRKAEGGMMDEREGLT